MHNGFCKNDLMLDKDDAEHHQRVGTKIGSNEHL